MTLTTATGVGVVEDLFVAWNAGDVETFIALQSEEALTDSLGLQHPFQEQSARDAFLFYYMLGAEWVLTECTARSATAVQGDVVICRLTVNTDWTRAYGIEDLPSRARFVVDRGIITENSFNLTTQSPHEQTGFALVQWLSDSYGAEFTEACVSIHLPDFATTPRCAEFIQLHLDDWKTSLETEG